ncbi:hypothetical protein [Cellulomonas edaphi]|uniref:ABC transporter ATP-binding protein n=1 Tax=Cellulomonas edaphi TaxID=3053468 RepID=A0ABT7S8D6_9CELL|nr:hypothetical protein [Cellulomons edaphi]MDM7831292.1 hypothetical protein [Cellulomons edaphi]
MAYAIEPAPWQRTLRAPAGQRLAVASTRLWSAVVRAGVLYTMTCVVDPGVKKQLGLITRRDARWSSTVGDLRAVLTRSIFDYAIVPGLFAVLATAVATLWVGQQLGDRLAAA